jgi:hypothetical protein
LWTFRFNDNSEPLDPGFPSRFKRRVRLDDAIVMIERAIQQAESEVELGNVEIDDAFARVLFEGIRLPSIELPYAGFEFRDATLQHRTARTARVVSRRLRHQNQLSARWLRSD